MDEELVEMKGTFLDEIIKGAIVLVASAFVTKFVDEGYTRFIIARRYKTN